MTGLHGVYHILTTPFAPDGALDVASVERLTDAVMAAGVDGITILGVAGEAQKLTDAERDVVLTTVLEHARHRVPIIVGASRDGTDATIAACQRAEEHGAAGVMIAPPLFVAPGPGLTEHFRRIAAATRLPITLQDFPPTNGVTMSPRDMADLVHAVPSITTIKLEDVPTPVRVGQTLTLLTDDTVTIVGGLGGVYLLDELRQGASGTMTGFAYPEVLIAITRAMAMGDRRRAMDLYARFLPLLVFEGQPKIGLAVRKAILARRGWIKHDTIRHPGMTVPAGIREDLNETLAALESDMSTLDGGADRGVDGRGLLSRSDDATRPLGEGF